jgi:hypothetical protein
VTPSAAMAIAAAAIAGRRDLARGIATVVSGGELGTDAGAAGVAAGSSTIAANDRSGVARSSTRSNSTWVANDRSRTVGGRPLPRGDVRGATAVSSPDGAVASGVRCTGTVDGPSGRATVDGAPSLRPARTGTGGQCRATSAATSCAVGMASSPYR